MSEANSGIEFPDDDLLQLVDRKVVAWTKVYLPPFLLESDLEPANVIAATWDQYQQVLRADGLAGLTAHRDALADEAKRLHDYAKQPRSILKKALSLREVDIKTAIAQPDKLRQNSSGCDLLRNGYTVLYNFNKDDGHVDNLAPASSISDSLDFIYFRVAILMNVIRRYIYFGETRKWSKLGVEIRAILAETDRASELLQSAEWFIATYDRIKQTRKRMTLEALFEAWEVEGGTNQGASQMTTLKRNFGKYGVRYKADGVESFIEACRDLVVKLRQQDTERVS